MKQNLVVLLADIFNLFEIHPAPCVDCPESEVASGEFTSLHDSINQLAQLSILFASFAFSSLVVKTFLVNMFVVCEKFLCATRERNRKKKLKQWLGVFLSGKDDNEKWLK